ncbi:DUF397 domain-containing protein [Streptomyces silvisoli]|uniref:DUF397 domain-containing protein n=1 Tax=Streptomyces silvisoli TaxID=3034235 RepID=A0ABT5ZVW0_9ACTN|nr:DUF397 domain-containing protein [Streptomyces silvisoli]MDF3293755.1 DUF397 domain-containing protein [Streptomyces silvisoli]
MSTANLVWFKSSYSAGNGGQCIEVATCPTAVHVRDSKDPEGPALAFTLTEWSAFLRLAVSGGNS